MPSATLNLLVVGSCTKDKDKRNCPYELTASDFEDSSSLSRRETQLSAWTLPAAKMYTGWQHRYMMNGIDLLRRKFGSSACSLKIVSAGYGLIDEQRSIVPYEVTFHGRPHDMIRKRADVLGIPDAVRTAVQGLQCVVFLLGKEYLLSTRPPLRPSSGQRFVFLSSTMTSPFRGTTIVPAGRSELRYGAGYAALKGKMFERFATGLCVRLDMWDSLCSDDSPRTVLSLIESGIGVWAASTT